MLCCMLSLPNIIKFLIIHTPSYYSGKKHDKLRSLIKWGYFHTHVTSGGTVLWSNFTLFPVNCHPPPTPTPLTNLWHSEVMYPLEKFTDSWMCSAVTSRFLFSMSTVTGHKYYIWKTKDAHKTIIYDHRSPVHVHTYTCIIRPSLIQIAPFTWNKNLLY